MAISGIRILVGAVGVDYAGRAYVYDLNSASPALPVTTLHKPGSAAGDQLAWSVALDGIVNLLEMAFGRTPLQADNGTLAPAQSEDGYLTMTLTKQPGAAYEVQSAGTLLPSLPDSFSASSTTVLINDATTLKVRDNSLIGSTPARFIRVQVTGAP